MYTCCGVEPRSSYKVDAGGGSKGIGKSLPDPPPAEDEDEGRYVGGLPPTTSRQSAAMRTYSWWLAADLDGRLRSHLRLGASHGARS